LQVSPKVRAAFSQMFQRYKTQNDKANQALPEAFGGLVESMVYRGKPARNLEERFHDLYSAVVDLETHGRLSLLNPKYVRLHWDRLYRAQAIVNSILEDLAPARKALEEFSAKISDPLYFDQAMQGSIKANPAQAKNYAIVMAAACAAVYGERQLKAWDLPQKIGRLWLHYADDNLSAAEKGFQYDKSAEAKARLTNATTALAQAKSFRIPADVLAARAQRFESIKASAGSGKLRRARRLLTEVDACINRGSKGGAKDADEKLASAKGWVRLSFCTPRGARFGVQPTAAGGLFSQRCTATLGPNQPQRSGHGGDTTPFEYFIPWGRSCSKRSGPSRS
jgi:hypothetical protein